MEIADPIYGEPREIDCYFDFITGDETEYDNEFFNEYMR